MRPRSVGTFLISRPETSAKLSARPRMRSMSSRERSSIDSRWRLMPGSSTAARDCHFVDPVDLLDPDVDPLAAGGGQVLADVVGPDRQLAVAAVGEHRQLHPLGPSVVEQRVDAGAHRAPGVEHVVDEHDRRVLDREVDVGGVHDRLGRGVAPGQVVAVEADVDVAERDGLPHQLGHQVAQPGGQHGAATVDPDDRDSLATRLLDDLMCDPHQRAPHVLAVEDRLLGQATAPSWPRRTGLKERRGERSTRSGHRPAAALG